MVAALPGGGTAWIMIGMAILMAVTLLIRARGRRSGMGVDLKERGPGRDEVRESMDRLFVQLQEFSRETLARLDMKMRMLTELLDRADRTVAQLKQLDGEARPAPAKAANPLHEKVFRMSDEGKSSLEIGEATGLQSGEVEMVLGLRGKRP